MGLKLTRTGLPVLFAAVVLFPGRSPGASAFARSGQETHSGVLSDSANAIVRRQVRFEVLSPTLVRMEFSPTSRFIDDPTVVVINRHWPKVGFRTREKDGWLMIDTGRLTLRYQLACGRFTRGNLRVSWKAGGAENSWEPGDQDKRNLGGITMALENLGKDRLPPVPPGLLSRSGYFLLDDSASPIWDNRTSWIAPRPETGAQDWYFFLYGHDYAHGLKEFAGLSGNIPLIPRYTLGAMITDLNYEYKPDDPADRSYTCKNVEDLALRFRKEGIPLDVLVLDFAWHKFGWKGGYDWSPIFPHPEEFLRWARMHGLKISLNDHPGYDWKKGTLSNEDSHAPEVRRLLSIPSGTPISFNLADKRQAEVYMKALHDPLIRQGVSFWWIDGGKGAAKMPGLNAQMWTNRVFFDMTESFTHQRAFVMSRYGGWGNQRYPAAFTGDTNAEWPALDYEVPFTARGGNVLMPFITHDIGGFGGVRKNEPFDLYARWVEFGVFSPVLRLHSGHENPRDGNWRMPWVYGQQGLALARKYFRLRYRLLPYIYTYARVAHDQALPLVRPLYLEFPDLEQAYSYPGEYFFGDEMLVAPVTSPSGEKDVYLPPGSWTDYFSGQVYEGGRVLHLNCPIDQTPVFVKAGAILPLAPDMEYSDQRPLDRLTLQVYGPRAGRFDLYEDDGISLGYRAGQYSWTPFVFSKPADRQWRMTIGPARGRYIGQVKNRAYEIQIHGLSMPEAVTLGGRALRKERTGEGWSWDADRSVLTISLPPASATSQTTLAISCSGDRLRDR